MYKLKTGCLDPDCLAPSTAKRAKLDALLHAFAQLTVLCEAQKTAVKQAAEGSSLVHSLAMQSNTIQAIGMMQGLTGGASTAGIGARQDPSHMLSCLPHFLFSSSLSLSHTVHIDSSKYWTGSRKSSRGVTLAGV